MNSFGIRDVDTILQDSINIVIKRHLGLLGSVIISVMVFLMCFVLFDHCGFFIVFVQSLAFVYVMITHLFKILSTFLCKGILFYDFLVSVIVLAMTFFHVFILFDHYGFFPVFVQSL